MKRHLASLLSAASLCALGSCGSTGQSRVELELFAQGRKASEVAIEGATLRLTRADVAFGPLYLCATESAESELCETALAESLSTETCNALSSATQRLGLLAGTTGSVRSGFFDYGISWGLAQSAPLANEGSAGGHSARLEGVIEIEGGADLTFRADLDIEPLSPGDAAVNGLSTAQRLSDDTRSLTIVFDPNAWLRRIKLERILELPANTAGQVVFEPGSQPYEAILQAMTANAPPTLIWNRD